MKINLLTYVLFSAIIIITIIIIISAEINVHHSCSTPTVVE